MMGKITCANVLSDLYAMGVVECDNLVLLMSICTQMTDDQRDVVSKLFIEGFKDNANIAGVKPICQNIVYNPWLIIGGVATSICQQSEFIMPNNSQINDVLVLTKPLGAQMATNIYRWWENEDDRYKKLTNILTEKDVSTAFNHAIQSMSRLNRNAAKLMHKYKAHASTDVTGFGLLGHAQNLAQSQTNKVKYVINTLPIIAKMTNAAEALGNASFIKGTTAETSGGLLISLPKENANEYCEELLKLDGYEAWIVGNVVEGENNAEIINNPNVIQVNFDK